MCRFSLYVLIFFKINFKVAVTVFVGLTIYFGVAVQALHLSDGYVVL